LQSLVIPHCLCQLSPLKRAFRPPAIFSTTFTSPPGLSRLFFLEAKTPSSRSSEAFWTGGEYLRGSRPLFSKDHFFKQRYFPLPRRMDKCIQPTEKIPLPAPPLPFPLPPTTGSLVPQGLPDFIWTLLWSDTFAAFDRRDPARF